ncbi:MAG: hypothetical protein QF797_14020 [Alphaproteobacteria bacterium]|nr:hypothetical protein [Alphaproteobacteria bacterium]MDP6624443.1 hypothetical protein [Alphaproteobacteria bacterium]
MKEFIERLLFAAAFLAAAGWLVWQSPLRDTVALEGTLESFTVRQWQGHLQGYTTHHAELKFRLEEFPDRLFVYHKEGLLGWLPLPFTAVEARATLEEADELVLRLRQPGNEVMDIYRHDRQILGPFPTWLVWGILMAVGGGLLGLIGLIMLTAPLIDRLSQSAREAESKALARRSAKGPD